DGCHRRRQVAPILDRGPRAVVPPGGVTVRRKAHHRGPRKVPPRGEQPAARNGERDPRPAVLPTGGRSFAGYRPRNRSGCSNFFAKLISGTERPVNCYATCNNCSAARRPVSTVSCFGRFSFNGFHQTSAWCSPPPERRTYPSWPSEPTHLWRSQHPPSRPCKRNQRSRTNFTSSERRSRASPAQWRLYEHLARIPQTGVQSRNHSRARRYAGITGGTATPHRTACLPANIRETVG
ncbi:unnamed protein product, partial [Ixodes pacificus]